MTFINWLNKYYKIQREIVLVYRPDLKTGWGGRCMFLDENFNPRTKYNHRSMLLQEVVIEFDAEDVGKNRANADTVASRLTRDGILWAKWTSGNKSTHVHCLLNVKGAVNVPMLKRIFMRRYCEGLPLPDMQLAAPNHLIRAEFGIHEKTGKYKELISKSPGYPALSDVPQPVWEQYVVEYRESLAARVVHNSGTLTDHPGFKYILTAHNFREADDGRERALFMLIHTLKPQYADKQAEFAKFLAEWYRYSGGRKLTDRDIWSKVQYHWERSYKISERYLNELLESIGRSDLMRKVSAPDHRKA